MLNYHRTSRSWTLLVLLLAACIAATAADSRAEDPPDSIAAVQELLPDSTLVVGKVVYVDFWASWCVPCRQSFPWMQALYEKYRDRGLEIVAVNVDRDPRAAAGFLQNHPATFSIVYDSTGSVARLYGLETIPASFVYARDGRLVGRHAGFQTSDADRIEKEILSLLNQERTE